MSTSVGGMRASESGWETFSPPVAGTGTPPAPPLAVAKRRKSTTSTASARRRRPPKPAPKPSSTVASIAIPKLEEPPSASQARERKQGAARLDEAFASSSSRAPRASGSEALSTSPPSSDRAPSSSGFSHFSDNSIFGSDFTSTASSLASPVEGSFEPPVAVRFSHGGVEGEGKKGRKSAGGLLGGREESIIDFGSSDEEDDDEDGRSEYSVESAMDPESTFNEIMGSLALFSLPYNQNGPSFPSSPTSIRSPVLEHPEPPLPQQERSFAQRRAGRKLVHQHQRGPPSPVKIRHGFVSGSTGTASSASASTPGSSFSPTQGQSRRGSSPRISRRSSQSNDPLSQQQPKSPVVVRRGSVPRLGTRSRSHSLLLLADRLNQPCPAPPPSGPQIVIAPRTPPSAAAARWKQHPPTPPTVTAPGGRFRAVPTPKSSKGTSGTKKRSVAPASPVLDGPPRDKYGNPIDPLDAFFGVTPEVGKAMRCGYANVGIEVNGGWKRVQDFRSLLRHENDEDEDGEGDWQSASDGDDTDDVDLGLAASSAQARSPRPTGVLLLDPAASNAVYSEPPMRLIGKAKSMPAMRHPSPPTNTVDLWLDAPSFPGLVIPLGRPSSVRSAAQHSFASTTSSKAAVAAGKVTDKASHLFAHLRTRASSAALDRQHDGMCRPSVEDGDVAVGKKGLMDLLRKKQKQS